MFIVLFSGFLITKTNEDFPYYHLPMSLQLVYNNLQFGLGNLSVAYNHFSSIFFINSVFYLPITKHFLFNLINYFFQIFFFTHLIILFINKSKISFFSTLLLSLTACVFILKFYRLAEYGVDMPGQLLVSLSIILISIILFNLYILVTRKIPIISISWLWHLHQVFFTLEWKKKRVGGDFVVRAGRWEAG